MRPIVIIDGNNLAFKKYVYDGQDVPLEIIQRMIDELKKWACHENCFVELCLDPCRRQPEESEYLAVLVEYGTEADVLVEQRALLHAYQAARCIVITNDSELRDTVRNIKVESITVDDFVLRKGADNFMPLPPIDQVPSLLPVDDGTISPVTHRNISRTPKKRKTAQIGLDEIYQQTLASREKQINISIISQDQTKTETFFRLNLPNWPVDKGIKFIIESACSEHRLKLIDLIGDINRASQQDMISLFDWLINFCRDEPDFVVRGGCMMDRIRLALIKRFPNPLTQKQIVEIMGGHTSGIKHKIQKNIPNWFEVERVT